MHAGTQSAAGTLPTPAGHVDSVANRQPLYYNAYAPSTIRSNQTPPNTQPGCVTQSTPAGHDAPLHPFSVVAPHPHGPYDYYVPNPIDGMHQLQQRLFDNNAAMNANSTMRGFALPYMSMFGNAQNAAAQLQNAAMQNQFLAAQSMATFQKFGEVTGRNNNNAAKIDEQLAAAQQQNYRYCIDPTALQTNVGSAVDIKPPHGIIGSGAAGCTVSPTETAGSNPSFYSQSANSAAASMFYNSKQVIPWIRQRNPPGVYTSDTKTFKRVSQLN
jgi:hypothetical protein